MNASTSAGGDRRPAWVVRTVHTVARVAPIIQLGLYVNWLVFLWTPGTMPPLATAITTVLLALVLSALGLRLAHDFRMCPFDVTSYVLLDPQGEVDRHLPKLAFVHRQRLKLAIFVIGMIPIFVIGYLDDGPLWGRIAFTGFIVAIAAADLWMDRSTVIHGRLQPWCPWCRNGRDDDEAFEPEPTPDPAVSISR